MLSVTEGLDLKLNINLSSLMWLVTTVLNSTAAVTLRRSGVGSRN